MRVGFEEMIVLMYERMKGPYISFIIELLSFGSIADIFLTNQGNLGESLSSQDSNRILHAAFNEYQDTYLPKSS